MTYVRIEAKATKQSTVPTGFGATIVGRILFQYETHASCYLVTCLAMGYVLSQNMDEISSKLCFHDRSCRMMFWLHTTLATSPSAIADKCWGPDERCSPTNLYCFQRDIGAAIG